MTIETNYNILNSETTANGPNFPAMLNDLNDLAQEYKILCADLNPPNPAKIKVDLEKMLGFAKQLNADANKDLLIAPTIGITIDSIENAITLLNAGDLPGLETIITNPYSNFQQSIGTIRQFILYPQAPIAPQAPNDPAILNEIALLKGYLAEFQKDLEAVPPNLNDADRIYGYVLTAAANIFNNAPDDASISPIAAEIIGTIDNIRALFLSNPPDIKGCLALLNDGSLQQQMDQIFGLIISA